MELTVTFIVLETGARVEKRFDSYYKCRLFVNKLRHSSKCRLVAYPLFRD